MTDFSAILRGLRSAFTLVELLTSIALLAIMLAVVVPTVANYVSQARRTTDKQALLVLNDAINRYKMQGGDVAGLTVGKPFSNLVAALQSPVNWHGVTHQFLKNSDNFENATTIAATGSGRAYRLTSFNSYQAESGQEPGDGPPETITFDNANSAQVNADADGVLTVSLSQGALTNGYIVVAVSWWESSTPNDVTGVTYDGAAMTLLGKLSSAGSPPDAQIALFGLAVGNKSSGSYNTIVTTSGTLDDREISVGVASYSGVHQSASTGSFASATANNTSAAVTVTSASGEMVVGGLASWIAATVTPGSGTTTRAAVQGVGGNPDCVDVTLGEEAGGASVGFGWSLSASQTWAIGAIPLKQAP